MERTLNNRIQVKHRDVDSIKYENVFLNSIKPDSDVNNIYGNPSEVYNSLYSQYLSPYLSKDYSKEIYNEAMKWLYKNYGDMIIKEGKSSQTYLFNKPVLFNKNIDIDTADTTFRVDDVSFFEKMYLKDTHIRGAVDSVINSITSRSWEIVPDKNSKNGLKIVEFLNNTFNNVLEDFSEVIQNLARSVIYGFSIQEIIWGKRDGDIVPVGIEWRDPTDFVFGINGELYFIKGNSLKELPRNKFLIHSFNGDSLNPYGDSIIGERVFWMYYFKRIIWRFRTRFLERFGNPLVIHKFQTEEERIKIKEALIYMSSKGAIQVPEGSEINPVEVSRDTQDFKDAIDDLNKEIEIAIAGQTATMSRESGGSYASDYIRQDQFYNKIGALIQSIESTINNFLIKPIIKINFPREKYFPKIVFNRNDDTLKLKEHERYMNAIRQNMPINTVEFMQKFGYKVPSDMDVNSTFGAYYDTKGNVRGGLPPEIRRQMRQPINDPRAMSEDEYFEYDSKEEGENDPDTIRKKNQEIERERIRKINEEAYYKPPEDKGKVSKGNSDKKSAKSKMNSSGTLQKIISLVKRWSKFK